MSEPTEKGFETEMRRELHQPIPLDIPSTEGWQTIPITENHEPLLALGPFSDNRYDRLFTDSLYAGERANSPYASTSLDGSLTGIYLRTGVAERLRVAEKNLPSGLYLVVWDGFRPLEVQGALYEHYRGKLKELQPTWDDRLLDAETQKYVSVPSLDQSNPSPHNTGGSVDLDIVRLDADKEDRLQELDLEIRALDEDESRWNEVYRLEIERMTILARHSQPLVFGAQRDHGGESAALNFFERLSTERTLTEHEHEARANRRLLYNAMRLAGMQPYEHEFWHYNAPESQMGAKTAHLAKAEYGAAEFTPDLEVYEKMRQMHLQGITILAERQPVGKVRDYRMQFLREVVKASGHPRETVLPNAEEIQPEAA